MGFYFYFFKPFLLKFLQREVFANLFQNGFIKAFSSFLKNRAYAKTISKHR
jgi:hypothetical protein